MSFRQIMPTGIHQYFIRAIRPQAGIQLALLAWLVASPLCAQNLHQELSSSNSAEICEAGSPQLHVDTSMGQVVIELFESAAPQSVRQLVALIEETGYYEEAAFDYTKPNRELRLTAKDGAPKVDIDLQIDAAALGLDKDEITSAGQAMTVLQRELLVAFAKNGKRVEPGSQLESWLQNWYQARDPQFLVGTSRQAINEALGFRYETGLDSRPATRGMVALRPSSGTQAGSSMSFLLCDMPERTGRWMVIGEVTRGLEVLEAIGLRPLVAGMYGHKFHQPADPIQVREVRKICGPKAAGPLLPMASDEVRKLETAD